MNKSDVVKRVAGAAGVAKHEAESVIDAFFQTARKAARKGDKVSWPGVGSISDLFKARDSKASGKADAKKPGRKPAGGKGKKSAVGKGAMGKGEEKTSSGGNQVTDDDKAGSQGEAGPKPDPESKAEAPSVSELEPAPEALTPEPGFPSAAEATGKDESEPESESDAESESDTT